MTHNLSHTTGTIHGRLIAVRCAHHCLESGQGYMLFELSDDYENVVVTPLDGPSSGYDIIKQCNNRAPSDGGGRCKGWNGVRFTRRRAAA